MTRQVPTKDLIELAQTGDRGAFDQLAVYYREELTNFVISRTGKALRGKIAIEDITQETLLKAFRSLSSFTWKGDRSFFRWLAGIAHNLIQHLARRHLLSERISLPIEPQAEVDSPSKSLRREERFDRLEDAVQALSRDHRRVILLTRVEGLSIEEVAKKMNRSPKATRQLLWRALQNLREHFGDTESYHLPDRLLKGTGSDNE